MPVRLLDVNVLLALAWPMHQHHRAAHEWFTHNSLQGWATCPMTQCGFARISLNSKLITFNQTAANVVVALETLIRHSHHTFWPDDISVLHPLIQLSRLQGHRQTADAYLLGLSLHHKGQLATFDAGILSLATTSEQRNAIVLIPT